MAFNEDSRVKIPAILHLIRLGYEYLSLKNANWDQEIKIYNIIFKNSFKRNYSDIKELDKFENIILPLRYKRENIQLENQKHIVSMCLVVAYVNEWAGEGW
jgi:type I restriction enzyme R subunit